MSERDRRANRIRPDEILDLGEYERRRDEIRLRVIAARKLRRVQIGANATLSFENRETVIYQIQEMLRAERLAKPEEVQQEIDTYSDLLPSGNALSATLMFEYPDAGERGARLSELLGFDRHLRLEIDGVDPAAAVFDRRQVGAERISSVQFVRFPLTEAQRNAVAEHRPIEVVADHPHYRCSAEIPREMLDALVQDLCDAAAMERNHEPSRAQ